jgi:hypothetical protein
MKGAKIATTIQATAITLPTTASGCRHAGRSLPPRLRARIRKATVLT